MSFYNHDSWVADEIRGLREDLERHRFEQWQEQNPEEAELLRQQVESIKVPAAKKEEVRLTAAQWLWLGVFAWAMFTPLSTFSNLGRSIFGHDASRHKTSSEEEKRQERLEFCRSVRDAITPQDQLCGAFYARIMAEPQNTTLPDERESYTPGDQ